MAVAITTEKVAVVLDLRCGDGNRPLPGSLCCSTAATTLRKPAITVESGELACIGAPQR